VSVLAGLRADTARRGTIDGGAAGACAAARLAQRTWAGRSLRERAALLEDAAALLATEGDALAGEIVAATSRPPGEIWSAEIVPTVDALRWLARHADVALRRRRLSRSRLQWYFHSARHEMGLEPYGVIGIVTPSNSLLFLAVPQIAAALVAGNSVVWKPAPAGGAVSVRVAALFRRAGLPSGALQLVHGGAGAARELVVAGVDKLHFTGGTASGLELYRLQAEQGRPAVLELSGRHIAIVLDDADAAMAAAGIVWGKLLNGGRNCISVQLVLATPAIASALTDALSRALAEAGSAEPGTEDAARLAVIVDDAVARGARVVYAAPWPALVGDVAAGMRIVDEELQGPVLAVATVGCAADALAWVNDAAHRLSASIWTSSPSRARELARRLDVGQVWINEQLHPAAQPAVTLAGRGRSGFGASRGLPGLMEMVQPKVISEMPLGGRRRHYTTAAGALDLFRATARLGAGGGRAGRVRALASMACALVRMARERRV
jgi:acyl-CoA reductase-like NAD-dependent aldehyde dehydrogenase